jgi:hypothetical protein
VRFFTKALLRQCAEKDTMCWEERDLMIGILVHSNREETQNLVETLIFKNNITSTTELRRCLIHCAHLNNPNEVCGIIVIQCRLELHH